MKMKSGIGGLVLMLLLSSCKQYKENPSVFSVNYGTLSGIEYSISNVEKSDKAINFDVTFSNKGDKPQNVYLANAKTPEGVVPIMHLSIASAISCYPSQVEPKKKITGHYVIPYKGQGPVSFNQYLVTGTDKRFETCIDFMDYLNKDNKSK